MIIVVFEWKEWFNQSIENSSFVRGKNCPKFCAQCCSRLRTVCEVEQAAVNNPFARFAINTIKWAMTISTMVKIFFSSSVRTCPACPSTRPRWTPAWVDRTALSSTRSARSPTPEPSSPSCRFFNKSIYNFSSLLGRARPRQHPGTSLLYSTLHSKRFSCLCVFAEARSLH